MGDKPEIQVIRKKIKPQVRRMVQGQIITGNVKMNTAEAQPEICDLSAYNLRLQDMETEIQHYGGHDSLAVGIKVSAMHNKKKASEKLADVEKLIEDMNLLNSIRKSNSTAVKDLWGQLVTTLALTDED